jgi:3,4-dihydroxy 2-butanone 4-phosphate synthase / GTP cyclohydrolase II
MQTQIERVEDAVSDLKLGKMIILTDDPNRENEGDFVIPAETITADMMNFIIRNSSGIVCISLFANQLKNFNLPLMVPTEENTSLRGTPFTISVDAKEEITTGVSAGDRVNTIKVLMDDFKNANDVVSPGHVFPLQAKNGGILERQGHTEGALDLVTLAGFKPGAVLCEVMNADGTMSRGTQLNRFAKKHHLKMLSIDDLLTYRLSKENLIAHCAEAQIDLPHYGSFKMRIIKEKINGIEHFVLSKEPEKTNSDLLVRIHSSCLTGDLFSCERCDCHKQLHYSLERISKEGGMIIYLNQEGRGIGLFNKIKSYALQDLGFDTVEANEKLGFAADLRKYYMAATILRQANVHRVRLLTNNLDKINDLHKYGIQSVQREPMPIFLQEKNKFYLQTKIEKLKHVMNL